MMYGEKAIPKDACKFTLTNDGLQTVELTFHGDYDKYNANGRYGVLKSIKSY